MKSILFTHNSSFNEKNKNIVDDLIFNEKKHIVTLFKDYLILNESCDFFTKYFSLFDSLEILAEITKDKTINKPYTPFINEFSEYKIVLHGFKKKQRFFSYYAENYKKNPDLNKNIEDGKIFQSSLIDSTISLSQKSENTMALDGNRDNIIKGCVDFADKSDIKFLSSLTTNRGKGTIHVTDKHGKIQLRNSFFPSFATTSKHIKVSLPTTKIMKKKNGLTLKSFAEFPFGYDVCKTDSSKVTTVNSSRNNKKKKSPITTKNSIFPLYRKIFVENTLSQKKKQTLVGMKKNIIKSVTYSNYNPKTLQRAANLYSKKSSYKHSNTLTSSIVVERNTPIIQKKMVSKINRPISNLSFTPKGFYEKQPTIIKNSLRKSSIYECKYNDIDETFKKKVMMVKKKLFKSVKRKNNNSTSQNKSNSNTLTASTNVTTGNNIKSNRKPLMKNKNKTFCTTGISSYLGTNRRLK